MQTSASVVIDGLQKAMMSGYGHLRRRVRTPDNKRCTLQKSQQNSEQNPSSDPSSSTPNSRQQQSRTRAADAVDGVRRRLDPQAAGCAVDVSSLRQQRRCQQASLRILANVAQVPIARLLFSALKVLCNEG